MSSKGKARRPPKGPPRFWWDFAYRPDRIVLESSEPKRPVVTEWRGHSEAAQRAATKLVGDLTAGRRTASRINRVQTDFQEKAR